MTLFFLFCFDIYCCRLKLKKKSRILHFETMTQKAKSINIPISFYMFRNTVTVKVARCAEREKNESINS